MLSIMFTSSHFSELP